MGGRRGRGDERGEGEVGEVEGEGGMLGGEVGHVDDGFVTCLVLIFFFKKKREMNRAEVDGVFWGGEEEGGCRCGLSPFIVCPVFLFLAEA